MGFTRLKYPSGKWKKQALEQMARGFDSKVKKAKAEGPTTDQLYTQIGQLKVELDWLKKNLPLSKDLKTSVIDPDHDEVSISRQCELLGGSRSSYYYQARPETKETKELMNAIDEQYTKTPF